MFQWRKQRKQFRDFPTVLESEDIKVFVHLWARMLFACSACTCVLTKIKEQGLLKNKTSLKNVFLDFHCKAYCTYSIFRRVVFFLSCLFTFT